MQPADLVIKDVSVTEVDLLRRLSQRIVYNSLEDNQDLFQMPELDACLLRQLADKMLSAFVQKNRDPGFRPRVRPKSFYPVNLIEDWESV